jgi:hypothetical protein
MKMPRQLVWLARAVVIAVFLGIALCTGYQLVKFAWQQTAEDFP